MTNFNTPLYKAKGLGSSKNGAFVWLIQHTTAAIMLFLVPRGAYLFCKIIATSNEKLSIHGISKPVDAIVLWVFLVLGITHGAMGVKLVIEDYIEPKWLRIAIGILMTLITITTIIILTVVVLNSINK